MVGFELLFNISKYYDKTQSVPTNNYTLYGFAPNDGPYLTCNFNGLYRDYNANIGINVDVSNIRLTGPLAYNYKIINYTTVSGNIFFS